MSSHTWRGQRTIRTGKALLEALYFTLGTFLFLFVLTHIGGALYVSSISEKSLVNFRAGIVKDLAYLKDSGDEVAKNDLVKKLLIEGDSAELFETIRSEKDRLDIGLMGIANKEGVIVGRTKSVGKLGDNAFLTSVVGRIVSQGRSAESVEAPFGFDPNQVFLTTGRPIFRGDQMIGALFANYLTDDTYATRFRDTYLPNGVEVVFYNKIGGVFGNSFTNTDTRRLIKSYFSTGSEWIGDGASGKTISFKDGDFYLVENFIFPGLETSPGGALLFIPRLDFSYTVHFFVTIITLSIFILFALRHHVHSRDEERGWRYFALLLSASVPVVILVGFALTIGNIGYSKLEYVPYPLYNSTIRLQPESGIYSAGFEQRFSIFVDKGDEAINAVQVGLIFDTDAVEVTTLDTASSSCSYVIENTIDSKEGVADMSCVILGSGDESSYLLVGDVVLVPRSTGTFTLAFDQEKTKVLANDGLGTNVLRMSQSGSYRVDAFDQALFSSSTSDGGKSFAIFSPTHPNQSRWYNASTARFVWIGTPKDVYTYAVDDVPDTTPSAELSVQGSSVTVPILGDGIFYFHLRSLSSGSVSHYRIQADMTPPSITAIRLSSEQVFVGDVVRFSFDGKDTGSGIQRNFYTSLGNRLFLPVGQQLFVPFLDAGEQVLTLRVYDNAGNYSEKTKTVRVESR